MTLEVLDISISYPNNPKSSKIEGGDAI